MLKLRSFATLLALGFLAYALWASADFVAIATGIALFMFGMFCLENGFKTFTGGTLETILQHTTNQLWKSLSFGLITTTLMQSSSLVSLITVSFVSAEMIRLAAGIGIIMGANIGTTTGAWLIAGLGLKVDIAAYAMPILVFGVLFQLQKNTYIKATGYLLLGFAFLFLGIHYMKEGFETFQQQVDLSTYAMTGLAGVLIFTVIGMLITVIMQSSHATLLIIISALATEQVNYENALALAIGANLGSTITIILGSLAANLGGKRLAASHVLFNVSTAWVAIIFLQPLKDLVDLSAQYLGIPADDYLLKLALFHTLFNLIGVVMLAPFITKIETLLNHSIKTAPKRSEQPLYLHKEALHTPSTALYAVKREVEHLLDNAYGLLAHGINLKRSSIESEKPLLEIIEQTHRHFPLDLEYAYEEKIKSLHNEIIAFIAEAQAQITTPEAIEALDQLRQASRDIVLVTKNLKHLHKNMQRYGLSQNLAIRHFYNQIRLQLAVSLREMRQVMAETPNNVTILSLDSLKLSAKQAEQQLVLTIDNAIRQHKIPKSVATSVLNDETYMLAILNDLISVLKTLRSPTHMQTLEALSLTEEEINTLLTQRSKQ